MSVVYFTFMVNVFSLDRFVLGIRLPNTSLPFTVPMLLVTV